MRSIGESFRAEKEKGRPIYNVNKVHQRIEFVTKIPKSVVCRMLQHPELFPPSGQKETRKREPPSLTQEHQLTIKEAIRDMRRERVVVSLRNLLSRLKAGDPEADELPRYPWCLHTLSRGIARMGYYLKKKETYAQVVQETPRVLEQRMAYLRLLRRYRSERREIFYQDESWLSALFSKDHSWWLEEFEGPDGAGKAGRAARAILCGAGSASSGWLRGRQSLLMFDGTPASKGDFLADMTWERFQQWASLQVLPFLPPTAVLVVDRAQYHMTPTPESALPSFSSKEDAIDWLLLKCVQIRDSAGTVWSDREEMVQQAPKGISFSEVRQLVKKCSLPPVLQLAELVRAENARRNADIKLLLLPLHHPELNPLSYMWAHIRNYISLHNLEPGNLLTIKRLFWDAFDQASAVVWDECLHSVLRWEALYFQDADPEEVEDDDLEQDYDLTDPM